MMQWCFNPFLDLGIIPRWWWFWGVLGWPFPLFFFGYWCIWRSSFCSSWPDLIPYLIFLILLTSLINQNEHPRGVEENFGIRHPSWTSGAEAGSVNLWALIFRPDSDGQSGAGKWNLWRSVKPWWGQGEFRNFFSAWPLWGSEGGGSSWFHTTLCVSPGIISWRPDRLSGFSLSHCLQREGELSPGMGAGNGSSSLAPEGKDSWVQAPHGTIHPEFHGLGCLKHIQGLASSLWSWREATRLEKEEEWKVCSLYKAISSLQQSCGTSKHAQKQTPPCAACSAPGATSWQKMPFEFPPEQLGFGGIGCPAPAFFGLQSPNKCSASVGWEFVFCVLWFGGKF